MIDHEDEKVGTLPAACQVDPAVSSFFIPKLLGGGQYFLIGNMIENQFITVGEWNFGSAISMIMAVIMMVLMMVVRKIEIRNQGGKGV